MKPSSQDTLHDGQLARALSPMSVWALALGCIIGWGSFILPGTLFLPQAGPGGTALAMVVAAAAMTVIALNYGFMIARFPLAGGEHSYVHATFGRVHAFACSWLLGLCYLSLVAQNATALTVVGRSLLGSALQFGFHYQMAGFDVYAGELLVALGVLALFGAMSIRGVRLSGMLQTVLVFAVVFGVGFACVAALISPDVAVDSIDPLFSPMADPLFGVLAVLAVAPFAFVGFDTIPQAAEEYSFSPGRARRLVVVAIAFGALIYIALAALAVVVQPSGYSSWPAYIEDAPALPGVSSLPTFHSAYALAGPLGLVAIAVAACGAILSGIVGFYLASSRLLFAMGRAGNIPAWFAQVHPRYHTPHHAILFVMAVCFVAPFFGRTVLGWLVDMSSLGAAVAYGYTSLAVLKIARSEGGWRDRVLGLAGTAFSALFVALLLVPVPGLDAALGQESFVCLMGWAVLGVGFFFVSGRKTREGAA
ncbi:MAG: APC family permease [Eggerthellaceae bacterium]|nr:APC family permease [Eggerthellaceae bacterium]